ncbi:MAG: hypothetical protein H6650_12390 [Ardenticatenales bacterium]|nr:hypothetical protein [Ardenticatenales bacterium]
MASKRTDKPALGTCPSCDTTIRLSGKLHLGQIVTCPECGDDLEIVQLSPTVKLDWAFEEPFDDDDDFDYDDDDFDDDDDYDFDDEDDYDFDDTDDY